MQKPTHQKLPMETRTVIVAGWYTVDPERRDEVVASYEDLIGRARKAPGCLDFAISADTIDPSRINTFEFWKSEDHLDAWRAVSNSPKAITPMSMGDMQKHEIRKSGPPF